MKVVIFGIGQYCRSRISCFGRDEIVAFLDNKAKVGDTFFDIPVYHPERITELNYDVICLMAGAVYAKEMHKQLIHLGVDESVIFENDRLYLKKREDKEFNITCNNSAFENRTVVFVPNMANTGGIRAAMYAMGALYDRFGGLTVVSPCDGPIKQELIKLGYDIIIASDISERNNLLWKMIINAEKIMLNGLYYGYLVPYIEKLTSAKVLWWLHTGDSFYDTYPIPNGNMKTGHIAVAGVSELVCEAYRRHNYNRSIDVVPFGIPDECSTGTSNKMSKSIVFAVVGTVSKVKGIDVLLEAVERLENDSVIDAEFWIVGAEVNKKYAEELHKKFDHLKSVKWIGEKTHTEVMELYRYIDVLISSSIEDMLPIVTIEAMMHSKPCIVSDAVGTAGFMRDGEEGFIFPSRNSEELARIIRMVIDHPEKIEKMGQRGRMLFEKFFLEEVFKQNFIDYWEKKIEDVSSL